MGDVDPHAAALLEGLSELPIEEVRARRAACQALELQLSYVRRLVQGRLDIVGHEQAARRGEGVDGEDLVEGLKAALADHITSPGNGHLPTVMAPGAIDPELQAALDAAAPPGALADPKALTDQQLADAAAGLAALERDLSTRRRAMFDRIDALQEEIVRRYRVGEATVDGLLAPRS
jgi:hypothetical protein